MCSECHQSPCATMCPNGNPTVDEILIECALCGCDEDEAEARYGICEDCWTKYSNFDNARSYGATATEKVEINGLYAKILTPGQIDKALEGAVWSMKAFYPDATNKSVKAFISDDDGAFAAFLKEKAHDA